MANETYTPIETYTVSGTSTNTITFGSGGTLPQTYTDLILVGNFLHSTDGQAYIQFNGDTNGNYSRTSIWGDGSQRPSERETNQTLIRIAQVANERTLSRINIQNYSKNTMYKSVLTRWSKPEGYVFLDVSLWRDTSPITSITISHQGGGYYTAGSTFTLYGVANSNVGTPRATGGTITSDATYWYHAFGTSGTFTPTQSLTADVLVVAGGGGSGRANMTNNNAGAGAGGFRLLTNQSLTATPYTITVGAGGGGASNDGEPGGKGGNSSISGSGFTTISATGGGYSHPNSTAGIGGSGGGGGSFNSSNGASGNEGGYTPVEGYAGGQGRESGNYPAGGGGGAGAVGGTPATNSSAGGSGGIGSSSASSWGLVTGTGENVSGTVYYAGGGGGGSTSVSAGAGGYGGGGAGSNNLATNNGLANTGGGAGGSGGSPGQKNGANGGSGIVIVRYPR